MTDKTRLFQCGTLYTPIPESQRKNILVKDGVVLDLLTAPAAAQMRDVERVDLSGFIAGPGLVDIHCHGALASDFADGTEADIAKAATHHLKCGTTSLLAAIGSCTIEEMLRACEATRRLMKSVPNLLGVHLEGPHFNLEWYGCHLKEMIRPPSRDEWQRLEPYRDVFRLGTLAPELPGSLEFIRQFARTGTRFAIGHSDATYDQIRGAIDAGLSHSTHVFCAMPGARRVNLVLQPGVLESVLMLDELSTEIIADGIHVGPRLMEFVVKVKTSAKTALVSDALRGVGCPPGDYAFGPRHGQICRLIDTPPVGIVPDRPGILASSAITLSRGLQVCAGQTSIPLAEAWKMASATPARIVGLHPRKGSLLPGSDADILVLKKDLSVAGVYVKGERVSR